LLILVNIHLLLLNCKLKETDYPEANVDHSVLFPLFPVTAALEDPAPGAAAHLAAAPAAASPKLLLCWLHFPWRLFLCYFLAAALLAAAFRANALVAAAHPAASSFIFF
jgi:hypothetical protein